MSYEVRLKNDVILRELFRKIGEAIDDGDLEQFKELCKLHSERTREIQNEHSEKMARYYYARGGK